jgi:cell division protein FtsA
MFWRGCMVMKKVSIDENGAIFALDIGTRSVVGLIGTWDKEKIIINYGAMEFHKKRSMYDGQIHDIDGVVEVVKKVKEQLEEKAGFSLKEVAIAAAGRALKTHRITVEKEIDSNREIDKNLVNSIEIEGLQRSQSQLEEQQGDTNRYFCVGHTVVNYYLDDGLITNPVGHKGKKLAADLLATFLPQIVVDSLYSVMSKVGLEVNYMTLEPIAAIEAAVPQNVRLLNIALVDIGAGTSDIAITKDGTVIAYAMTSTAGDEITETLAKSYLLDFDSAEALKCNLYNKEMQYFADIVGIEHQLKTEEILEKIGPSIELVGKEIADNICIAKWKGA